MKRIMPALILAASLVISLSACQPTYATRGNFVDPDEMATIQSGTSSKEDVRAAIGTPTATEPLNDNIWYYVGQKTKRFGFQREKVMDRRVVAVTFDDKGIVQTVAPIENSGRELAMSKRITPTSGHSMTVLQQFFGNLGRFNTREKDTGIVGAEVPGQYN